MRRTLQRLYCGLTLGHVLVLQATVPVRGGRVTEVGRKGLLPGQGNIPALVHAMAPSVQILTRCAFCGADKIIMGEWW